MDNYKTALFIGRFQPFHKGHLYSLKKCLEIADRVVVGIGSSNISGTENNPWDYENRRKMVECVVRKEKIGDRVVKIVGVPDDPSDEVWLEMILEAAGEFEIVVSNNDWVLSIFKKAGYKTYESGLYKRDELEGVKIREMMKRGDRSWVKRVPDCVVELIGDPEVFC